MTILEVPLLLSVNILEVHTYKNPLYQGWSSYATESLSVQNSRNAFVS